MCVCVCVYVPACAHTHTYMLSIRKHHMDCHTLYLLSHAITKFLSVQFSIFLHEQVHPFTPFFFSTCQFNIISFFVLATGLSRY